MKEQPQTAREAKPGWLERYVLLSLKYPLWFFFVLTGLLVLSLGVFTVPSMITETEGNEWLIKKDAQTQRDLGLEDALDQFGKSSGAQPERSEDNFMLTFTFIYKSTKGSIFSDENMASIKEVERLVWGTEEYGSFCELVYEKGESRCATPVTPLNVFFEYDAATGEYGKRTATMQEGIEYMKENYYESAFYVSKTFNETGDSDYSRSQFSFGLPIFNRKENKTYPNSYTDDKDQIDYVSEEYLYKLRDILFDHLGMKASGLRRSKFLEQGKTGNVEVLFYAPGLEEDEFQSVILMDFSLAFLSILSVWIYMLIHLGSFFLATVGIFEVFVAFPVALFFYKLVFQIEYFDFLHLLVIFILLGIGADDVFVFTDAFKQSKAVYGVGDSLASRLVYTCKRASKAVFVTSFTTMAAFLASAASNLMPMQSFGIFAALCIVFLFVINVLLMPATLVLWSGYTPWCVKHVCCCFDMLRNFVGCTKYLPCCTCCHITPEDSFVLPVGTPYIAANNQPGAPVEHEMSKNVQHGQTSSTVPLGVQQEEPHLAGDENVQELRLMERFFNGAFFRFIGIARWPIIIAFSTLFAIGLWQVTGFEPPSETERWWPESHSFTKVLDALERSGPFVPSKDDAVAVVHLVWGIRGMSDDYSTFDPDDFGSVEYDEEFDPTTPEAQMHLLSVCRDAREAQCRPDAGECKRGDDEVGYLVLLDRKNGKSLKEQAPCWIESFDDWLKSDPDRGEALPLAPGLFKERLRTFTETNAAKINFPQDIGWIDTGKEEKELKFIQFRFDSTYQPPTSYSKAKPVLDSWADFTKNMNEEALDASADGVSRGYDTGREAWTWPQTQNSLVKSAVQGVVLVFVLAFVVLNIATQNIVISSISVLTVAGIVLTVLGVGIRGIMGWKLGIAESIVSTILVGFSMDYTLHLADAYVESHHKDRKSRTRDSLTHLGISVTAGAATTFISGIFLWFATVVFFTKFAFNITATILASYLWSILFFPAVCMVIGPEGNFGNWGTMIRSVLSICIPKMKQDQTT